MAPIVHRLNLHTIVYGDAVDYSARRTVVVKRVSVALNHLGSRRAIIRGVSVNPVVYIKIMSAGGNWIKSSYIIPIRVERKQCGIACPGERQ